MAGVSPQQRRGTDATTIGMIISVVVAVLLLGALIWLFTLQEQLRSRTDVAEKAKLRLNKELSGKNDEARLLVTRLTSDQGNTAQDAVAELDAAFQEFTSDDQIPLDDVGRLSAEFGAVRVMRELYQLYVKERQTLATAEEQSDRVDVHLEEAETAKRDLQAKFEEQVAALQAQLAELQQAKNAIENDKNTETAAVSAQLEARRDELDEMRKRQSELKREYRATLAVMDREMEEQRRLIRQLRGPAPSAARPLASARKPVGKVLRALPGDSLVHIDLGREDAVTLGMTFTVYSADERVPENGRGKASVEVKSVSQRTSECNVVSPPSPDDPILQGDLVGNIILGRNRGKTPRFSIVGEFDVDFDGRPDVRGREKIAALVVRWGGTVVERVDAMTDYVVVGLEPPGQEVVLTASPSRTVEDDEGLEDDELVGDDEDLVDDEDENEFDEDEDDIDDEDAEDEDDLDDDEDEADDDFRAGNGGIGAEQDAPLFRRNPEVDPTAGPRTRRYRGERERYEDALRRARMFSIPVLTQDQFFNFIGIEGTVSDIRRLES